MRNEERKIGTMSRFLQRLEAIETDERRILYFRGHSKENYKLEPSIYRNKGLITNEARMLKELIVRCPNDFDDSSSTFRPS